MFLILFSSSGHFTVSIFLTPISNLSTFSSIHLVLSCSVCIIFKPSMVASSHFLQNLCVPRPFFARNLCFSSEILIHTIHTQLNTFHSVKPLCLLYQSLCTSLHTWAGTYWMLTNLDKYKFLQTTYLRGYINIFHSTCPLPNCLFFSSILVFMKTLENSLHYTISNDKLTTPSCIHFTGSKTLSAAISPHYNNNYITHTDY